MNECPMAWETWLRSSLIWLCCSFISMNHSQSRSLNWKVFSNQCFCTTCYPWMGLKHDFVWQDVRAINLIFKDFPGLAVQLQICHHWLRGHTCGRVEYTDKFLLHLFFRYFIKHSSVTTKHFAPQLQSCLLGKAEITSFLLPVISDLQHLG